MSNIKQAVMERDPCGFWMHPDFPAWDEGTDVKVITDWFKERKGTHFVDWMEFSGSEDIVDKWFDGNLMSCEDWYPSCPEPGAFILSIHDTENGPVAIFFVPSEESDHFSKTWQGNSMEHKETYIEVEICVYKPTGYSITYLVKGTNNRWQATLRAVQEFEKQDKRAMECLNMIDTRISQPKDVNDRRVMLVSDDETFVMRNLNSKGEHDGL